jgi:hypothetical protein
MALSLPENPPKLDFLPSPSSYNGLGLSCRGSFFQKKNTQSSIIVGLDESSLKQVLTFIFGKFRG